MKIASVHEPFGLACIKFSERAEPLPPSAGEIQVRIHACSLNYHDYAVVMGMIPTSNGRIPLSDGAGVVEAAGNGVKEFAAGDAVVSCFFPKWTDGLPNVADFSTTPGDGIDGFACEYVTAPAAAFTHGPKNYSHEQSATLPTAALTAWRALVVNGGLKAGDNVLLLGTGGVSIFALQFAKAMGARVILTSSSDAKLDRAKQLGADHLINYKTVKNWGRAVLDLTDGKGVAHVVEVGGPATLPQSIAACAIGGHISLIGVLTGWEGSVPTAALMLRQQNLRGIVVGSRRHQLDMIEAIDAIGLKPVIDRSYKLDELAEAFRYEESGAHFGKICIQI